MSYYYYTCGDIFKYYAVRRTARTRPKFLGSKFSHTSTFFKNKNHGFDHVRHGNGSCSVDIASIRTKSGSSARQSSYGCLLTGGQRRKRPGAFAGLVFVDPETCIFLACPRSTQTSQPHTATHATRKVACTGHDVRMAC